MLGLHLFNSAAVAQSSHRQYAHKWFSVAVSEYLRLGNYKEKRFIWHTILMTGSFKVGQLHLGKTLTASTHGGKRKEGRCVQRDHMVREEARERATKKARLFLTTHSWRN